MKPLRLLSICLVLSLWAVPAMAQGPDSFFDVFWAELGGDVGNWNVLTAGGGSGYPPSAPGEWYQYPAPLNSQYDGWGIANPVPSWWNEWFYDGNLRPGYKVVDLAFDYSLVNPAERGGANIVINWSTPEWYPNPDSPPMLNEFVGRVDVGQVWLDPAGGLTNGHFQGSFNLSLLPGGPQFNPEWVSIDVSGYNVSITGGVFNHTCVPEPGTLALLITAGTGLLLFAWRRRR